MADIDTSADAVERYAAPFLFSTQRRAVMESRSHGDWVRYSDYKALLAERDQLQAQVEKACRLAEAVSKQTAGNGTQVISPETAAALADFNRARENGDG